jgi:hypothetical protein
MLSRLFQRIATKRLEKRFRAHFERASGPVLHRNAIAVAMMELEDPWVSQVLAEFSVEEQPLFLVAYECRKGSNHNFSPCECKSYSLTPF